MHLKVCPNFWLVLDVASDFGHFSSFLSLHSCRFLSCAVHRRRHRRAKGYSVLLFEVDICIIRLGCVIVSGLPPSEGAPEERGRCPAQQWRAPLLSAALQAVCTCTRNPPNTGGCTAAPSATRVLTCCEERKAEGEKRGEERGWSVQWEWEGRGLSKIFKHAGCELALKG